MSLIMQFSPASCYWLSFTSKCMFPSFITKRIRKVSYFTQNLLTDAVINTVHGKEMYNNIAVESVRISRSSNRDRN